ncbi:MAG: hypothetical protein QME77_11800 [bacterium]|nr:hypothetical protein [bacterium]
MSPSPIDPAGGDPRRYAIPYGGYPPSIVNPDEWSLTGTLYRVRIDDRGDLIVYVWGRAGDDADDRDIGRAGAGAGIDCEQDAVECACDRADQGWDEDDLDVQVVTDSERYAILSCSCDQIEGILDADGHIDAICIDTAGSWEGIFPPPTYQDYVVAVAVGLDADAFSPSAYAGPDGATVLCSRRYTAFVDVDAAIDAAIEAFSERYAIPMCYLRARGHRYGEGA